MPGVKLRDIFCSSHPYDKNICTSMSCEICPKLLEGFNCNVECPIYRITCLICWEKYIGETYRIGHGRFGEHLRYANNPDTPSYESEAMAVHYRTKHPGQIADLKFGIIRTEKNTLLRKIYEAYYIYTMKNQKLMTNLKLNY